MNAPKAPADPDPTRTTDLSSAGQADTADLSAPAHTPADPATATYDPAGRPTAPARHAGPPRDAIPGYEILGELGRGGMGVVWKARHLALDRVVALKMILAGPHAPPALIARFRDEARAVARFQHPHIVQIFEVGEVGDLPYFSLEYVDGGTLSKKIAREPQPPRYAAETVETLARAVQYAHDRGVIHRDLKPGNVLLAADGSPKLTDFGLAKQVEGDSGSTHTGQVVGTPSFMAPEQAEGRPDVGKPADVWALGAILYDLLTGRPPFAGSSVLDTLEMVRTREPVSPGQLAAHIPRDVETICLKCLQKEPAKRYASAGKLADDLRRFLDGRPILARPVPAVERAWRWAKRNRLVAGLGTAAAVFLLTTAVTGTTFAVVFDRQKREAENARDEEKRAKEAAEARRQEAETARGKEAEANAARMAVVTPTVNMFRQVAVRLDNQLRAKAAYAPLRRQMFAILIDEFKAVRAATAKYPNPLEDRADGINYSRLGGALLLANQVADARDMYDKAVAILAAVRQRHPGDPVHPRNLAAVLNSRADVALRLGDAAQARRMYADALDLRREWLKLVTDAPPGTFPEAGPPDLARHAIAQSHALLGKADLELGDPAAAALDYEAADRAYAALPPDFVPATIQAERTYVWDRLGDALLALGRPAEAEGHYRRSLDVRRGLADKYPKNAGFQRDVAVARMTLGDYLLVVKDDPAAAWAEYLPVFQTLARQAAADPDDLVARRDVSTARYKLGVVAPRAARSGWAGRLVAAGLFAGAERARAGLAALDRQDAAAQIDWMVALGRCGRAAEARAVGEAIRQQVGGDRRTLFHVACGYAVAAGGTTDPAEADRCRGLAVEVVKDLIARGWKDRYNLDHDPDLTAVQADPKFRAVVDQLPMPTRQRKD